MSIQNLSRDCPAIFQRILVNDLDKDRTKVGFEGGHEDKNWI